jgi:ribosomal protein L7/L12
MTLLWIFIGLVVLVLVSQAVVRLRVYAMRRAGIYPAAGQATMADVERLVRAGQYIWAIRVYREIHDVGLAEAKKAIDDLHIVV